MYIKFPKNEVVLTNFAHSVPPVASIAGAAFILSTESIDDASFEKSVGMDNVFTINQSTS